MMRLTWVAVVFAFVGWLGMIQSGLESQDSLEQQRRQAKSHLANGNFKDALQLFEKLVGNSDNQGADSAGDLRNAVDCLNRLGEISRVDDLLQRAIASHGAAQKGGNVRNWRMLAEVARQYSYLPHHGFIVAGEFERGGRRGGGQPANSIERDRARAVQLLDQILAQAMRDDNKREVAQFLMDAAAMILNTRAHSESWRLQSLTTWEELPDFEMGYGFGGFQMMGYPVDEEGRPIVYRLPESWNAAANDGERWRWVLDAAKEVVPDRLGEVLQIQAQFYFQALGVHTVGSDLPQHDPEKPTETGLYELHTLAENETIARLATGIKRFKLVEDADYIKMYREVAQLKSAAAESGLNQLANIFQNRRQYPKAADIWRENIERFGEGSNQYKQKQLQQIVGNWGSLEPLTRTESAGQGAKVSLVYRNARQVTLKAQRVDLETLLADVKKYLRSNPARVEWNQINLNHLGNRLINENAEKYVGDTVAQWSHQLEPHPDHFDKRLEVTTPLSAGGVYLLTADVQDGNRTHLLVWVNDLILAEKHLEQNAWFFVTESATGQPVDRANVEFFGYRQVRVSGNRTRIETVNFSEQTRASGEVVPAKEDLLPNYNWIVVARKRGSFPALLGFHPTGRQRRYDPGYNETKTFAITDRPVYRPGQAVKFKIWTRHAQYDRSDDSQFAFQEFPVRIIDPKGQEFYKETLKADAYGGVDDELTLPSDATLGQYSLQIQYEPYKSRGQWRTVGSASTFRVEEYKKPEFEVTVEAPSEPVELGEVINAKIQAKYYFGAPVTQATVHYKVTRTPKQDRWFPIRPWDWCYGNGYWWFAYDYAWYPGWARWSGCHRPAFGFWYGRPEAPPEVVVDREVSISADGTVQVEIDTSLAKALHGDTSHEYHITAEVRDQSRRTIVGTGSVVVAHEPFKIYTWLNRGHYRVGQTIEATFLAQTVAQKPVQGSGQATLYRVQYVDGKPQESVVQSWPVQTGEDGRAGLKLDASQAGQYRLALQLTDEKEHEREGAYVFTVAGPGYDGRDFRFNHLELVPDKAEYAPGETIRLQVNTDRVGSAVMLFVRPTNGVYLPPQLLRLTGKSTTVEIAVATKDMPNFFVEALTISDGVVHTEAKEIVVPPAKRVLNLEVLPNQQEYRPGEAGTVRLKLTDHDGKPFVGSTVVAIYDASVEYISGGSNVSDIKSHFWKWRRNHRVRTIANDAQYSYVIIKRGELAMARLGAYGGVIDEGLLATETAMNGIRAGGGAGRPMTRAAVPAEADGAVAGAAPARLAKAEAGGDASGEDAPLVQPTVRTQFADTALWVASLKTDEKGEAEVELKMPENLTAWKVKAWGMGDGTRVGSGEASVVTRKNLIVRLQAPRFLVETDEVVLSANVHNYLANDKKVQVRLDVDSALLQLLDPPTRDVTIVADGEVRVDWRAKVLKSGQAAIQMSALTDEESDAMQVTLPVKVHGMLKTESYAGTVRDGQAEGLVNIEVPTARIPAQSVLEIRYSPSLASAMVDALPYLAEYPYGCTEQTLNRFLPSVITQKVLLEMQLNLAEIREKRTNLNAQEIGDDRKRAEQWKRFESNPVFDEAELQRMVKSGLKRLTDMQNADGGWGWFSGYQERSFAHTTAVVVHGLQIAQGNDVALVPDVLERGVQWLANYQTEQLVRLKNAAKKTKPYKMVADNIDVMVYMVLTDAGQENAEMREFLYRDRNELAVYSKAMLGLVMHQIGDREKLEMLLQNLRQFLVQDEENETAYLKLPANNYWWYWYGSETEANAYYLKLLARVEPKGEVAPRLVKYLLNNRKHATYWRSTRDTALCVEAFADYIRASGESAPEMTVEVWMDGELKQAVEITPENLFSYNNRFVLSGEQVTSGSHEVKIVRRGQGNVYFNAYLTNFTLEEFITQAGLEVKIDRQVYRLERDDREQDVRGARGQAVGQRVEKYQRVLLKSSDVIESGQLVEVELVVESKNDYEYLMFEDLKAAGFEPVDVRSGYVSDGMLAYREMRDDRVTFFVRQLTRGKHSISYRLRAETPGKFSALPAKASAMYAPELRGNSNEFKVEVRDVSNE